MSELSTIVKQAQRGDQEAFGVLYERFKDMALNYAYSVIGDIEKAEDARQEAFIKAYNNLLFLREPEAFPGWLKKTVFRCALQISKGGKVVLVPIDPETRLGSEKPIAADRIQSAELRGHILKAIDRLPEFLREATRLYYVDGLKVREIAARLSVSTNTVGSKLRYARQALRDQLKDTVKEEVQRMRRYGDRRFEREASREAIRSFNKELRYIPLRKQEEAVEEMVVLLCAKGRMLRFLGEFDEAIQSFENGLETLRPGQSALLAGRLKAEIGLTRYYLGDLDEARGALSAARRLARREKSNLPLLPAIINNQGLCAWRAGTYGRARRYYNEALAACQGTECALIKADTANNLGLLDWRAGRLIDALDQFKAAMKSYVKAGGRYECAPALCNIGIIEEAMGREGYAKRHYDQALDIARELNHHEVETAALANLGSLALRREEWDTAMDLSQQALEIAQRVGNDSYQAATLENIALCHIGQDQLTDARVVLKKALDIAARKCGGDQRFSLGLVEIELRLHEGAVEGVSDELVQLRQDAKSSRYDAEIPRILRLGVLCQIKADRLSQARRALTRAVKECQRQGNRTEEKRLVALGKPIGWKP